MFSEVEEGVQLKADSSLGEKKKIRFLGVFWSWGLAEGFNQEEKRTLDSFYFDLFLIFWYWMGVLCFSFAFFSVELLNFRKSFASVL